MDPSHIGLFINQLSHMTCNKTAGKRLIERRFTGLEFRAWTNTPGVLTKTREKVQSYCERRYSL